MPRKLTKKSASAHKETPFRQQLIQALEHFKDPEWLGTHSPLAAPYFLGEHLLTEAAATAPRQRGLVLRRVIEESAYSLTEDNVGTVTKDEGEYLFRLLSLSFFNPRPFPQLFAELGISKATYYRPGHRPRAIQELESRLLHRIKPALRLERPAAIPDHFVHRAESFESAIEALSNGRSLAITGSSGSGKTTQAAYIAKKWGERSESPVFWYTVRPTLTDRFSALAFAVGNFLQSLDSSLLWMQLMAGGEEQDREAVVSLLRHDLEQLRTVHPLGMPVFCVDDLDCLEPSKYEDHAEFVGILQEMSKLTPLLLVGQKIPFLGPTMVELPPMTTHEAGQLLAFGHENLAQSTIDVIAQYTQGNPRLLELCLNLHANGGDIAPQLTQLAHAPSVESLFDRIWQRLSTDEAGLLSLLSVFRRPAPLDAVDGGAESEGKGGGLSLSNARPDSPVDDLRRRRLLVINSYGEVEVLPILKRTIRLRLTPQEEQYYHLHAARVRAERGETTAACYHYIQAGQANYAVWLWYNQRRQEIDQGKSSEAQDLFSSMPREELGNSEKEILTLLRSELRLLVGDYANIKRDIYSTSWSTPLLQSRAKQLEGELAMEQSQLDDAVGYFRQGLDDIDSRYNEQVKLQTRLGEAEVRRRNLQQGWQETLRAKYEVLHLQGNIQYEMGNHGQAILHLKEAIELAIELGYVEGEGRSRNNLALVYDRQDKPALADEQWQRASTCYERVGRLTWQAGISMNRAMAKIDIGAYDEAMHLLESALEIFSQLSHTRGCALAMFQLADAYFKQGDIKQAEEYAWRSLHEEESTMMAANFGLLADLSLAQTQLDDAELFATRSIEMAEKYEDLYSSGFAWRTRGQVLNQKNRPAEAMVAYGKAIDIFTELELENEIERVAVLVKTDQSTQALVAE